MTSAQMQAVCKALAYLVKHAPKETSERGKAERTAVLQGLTNAMRPSQTLASEAATKATQPQSAAASPAVDAHQQSAAPSIIGVNIIPPGGVLPTVRPGTTAGTPFAPRVADVPTED